MHRCAMLLALSPLVTACHASAPQAAPIANLAVATDPSAPIIAGDGETIVSGTITREQTRYTRNDPLVAGPGATIAIEVRRYEGEDTGAPLIAAGTVGLAPGTRFPIRYEVRAAAPLDAAAAYLVSAKIVAADDGGRPLTLMSEVFNRLHGITMDFTVAGLESCGSPTAGGACE